MASIPFFWWTDNNGNIHGPQTIICTFFKAGSSPASDMTIVDASFGILGYVRAKLTSTLHVIAECSVFGETKTLDINASSAVSSGLWYWINLSFVPGNAGSGVPMRLAGQVWAPGSVTPGQQRVDFSTSHGSNFSYNADFGYGVSTSSSYLGWPSSSGWEITKGMFYKSTTTGNVSPVDTPFIGPPSVDRSVDGNTTALWLCRDAVGPRSTILDSTTNHYDLTAGPLGMTVVLDGPYA